MNEQNDFERLVADQISETGMGAPPESAIQDTIARAGGSRRLPEWLALIKESPMRTNNHLAVGSPTVRVMAIMAATLLLALALAAAGAGAQRLLAADGPIIVAEDGSGDFTTLGEAVEATTEGDEILVRPGTYVEAVIVDKDVSIKGDGPVEDIIIMAPEDGPVYDTGHSWTGEETYTLALVGSDGELSGLTFSGIPARVFVDGGAPSLTGLHFDGVGERYEGTPVTAALVINGGSTPTVRENVFRSGGINVFEVSSPAIEDNRLETGAGIFGVYGDATIIRNNVFSGESLYGVGFGEAADILVEGNEITGRRSGIDAAVGAPTIKGNTISGSGTAAITVSGGAGLIDGNTLADNNIAIAWSGRDGGIEGNTISGGKAGIVIGSGAPIVRDNTVEGVEGRGIVVGFGASPILSANTSCGNGENLVVADGATADIADDNEICEDTPAE